MPEHDTPPFHWADFVIALICVFVLADMVISHAPACNSDHAYCLFQK